MWSRQRTVIKMGREVSRLAKSARGKNEMEDERSKSVGIMRLAMRALMGSDRRERSEKATKGGSREREDVTGQQNQPRMVFTDGANVTGRRIW